MKPNNEFTDRLTDTQYITLSSNYGAENLNRINDICRLYKQNTKEAKRFFTSLGKPELSALIDHIEELIEANER